MGREVICDFPRSATVTGRDLRSLETLHAGVGGLFAAALSAMLRSPVEVRLAGVDQVAYGKFVHSLASPSYFSVLKADPLGDRLMLDIELAVLYPMLDRMLGGGRDDEPSPRRAPSDIELPLAARITRLFLEQLRLAWQEVLPVKFEVLQVESQPRLLRVLPSEEMAAVLSFALTIGDRQGMMRLCVPCRAMRQIGDKLGGHPAEMDEASLGVEVVVELATSSIDASELAGLQVGDIIATETDADRAAVVLIDGEPRFRGKPGACDGSKAVVLSEAADCSPSQTRKMVFCVFWQTGMSGPPLRTSRRGENRGCGETGAERAWIVRLNRAECGVYFYRHFPGWRPARYRRGIAEG